MYNAAVYRDGLGRVLGAFAAARDITERVAAQKQVLQYQASLQSLAAELVRTEQRERRRIATLIHDNLAQLLAFAHMNLRELQEEAEGTPLENGLENTRALMEEALDVAGSAIVDLSPPILYELGLASALGWLGERFTRQHGITVEVDARNADVELPDEVSATVFEAVKELLANVAKHAGADLVTISLACEDGMARVIVQDNGVGFSQAQAGREVRDAGGFGLFSVRERLQHLGGSMEILSQPGQGTRAVLGLPVAPGDPETGGTTE
jgi:signal transduction histidine kinase